MPLLKVWMDLKMSLFHYRGNCLFYQLQFIHHLCTATITIMIHDTYLSSHPITHATTATTTTPAITSHSYYDFIILDILFVYSMRAWLHGMPYAGECIVYIMLLCVPSM